MPQFSNSNHVYSKIEQESRINLLLDIKLKIKLAMYKLWVGFFFFYACLWNLRFFYISTSVIYSFLNAIEK